MDPRRKFLKDLLTAAGVSALPALAQSTDLDKIRESKTIILRQLEEGKSLDRIDKKIMDTVIEFCVKYGQKNTEETWRNSGIYLSDGKDGKHTAIIVDIEQRTMAAYKDVLVDKKGIVTLGEKNRAGAYADKYPKEHKYDETIHKNAEFAVEKFNQEKAQNLVKKKTGREI